MGSGAPDPILALLPDERPWAFDRLPLEEQQWRARIFLAVWIEGGQAAHQAARLAFAWANAMQNYANDPDIPLADYKAWVLRNFTDDCARASPVRQLRCAKDAQRKRILCRREGTPREEEASRARTTRTDSG